MRPRIDPRITDPSLFEELKALYKQVDALMQGWSCPSSSVCCRFGLTGREPYVTSIELEAVQKALAKRGGQLSAAKRALPLVDHPKAKAGSERTCPCLDREGRCAIYDDRPLGCRTFFCAQAQKPGRQKRDVLHDLVNKLGALAARHRAGGDQTRPLGRVLGV